MVEFQGELIELGYGRRWIGLTGLGSETVVGPRAECIDVCQIGEGWMVVWIKNAVAALLLAPRFGVSALFAHLFVRMENFL